MISIQYSTAGSSYIKAYHLWTCHYMNENIDHIVKTFISINEANQVTVFWCSYHWLSLAFPWPFILWGKTVGSSMLHRKIESSFSSAAHFTVSRLTLPLLNGMDIVIQSLHVLQVLLMGVDPLFECREASTSCTKFKMSYSWNLKGSKSQLFLAMNLLTIFVTPTSKHRVGLNKGLQDERMRKVIFSPCSQL